jgi:hypothetical protein
MIQIDYLAQKTTTKPKVEVSKKLCKFFLAQ